MFESLSERLQRVLKKLGGQGRVSESVLKESLREVRMALLEADVALPVVKQFVDAVKQRALGQEVMKSLSPGQVFLKIVQTELEAVMGSSNEGLNLATQPPAVILMAGLQGAGKTTSVAKLAKLLKERDKKSPKRPRGFTFRFKPPDNKFHLNIRFRRSEVSKDEIITTLRDLIKQLQHS